MGKKFRWETRVKRRSNAGGKGSTEMSYAFVRFE
jgi:hypothetical protein